MPKPQAIVVPKPELVDEVPYMQDRIRLFLDLNGEAFALAKDGSPLSQAMLLSSAFHLAKHAVRLRKARLERAAQRATVDTA